MIKTETSIREITTLFLPVFNKYNITDVWLIGEFADKKFTKYPVVSFLYDDTNSIIASNIDELFHLYDDLYEIAENVAAISVNSARSDKIKSVLESKVKLDLSHEKITT